MTRAKILVPFQVTNRKLVFFANLANASVIAPESLVSLIDTLLAVTSESAPMGDLAVHRARSDALVYACFVALVVVCTLSFS